MPIGTIAAYAQQARQLRQSKATLLLHPLSAVEYGWNYKMPMYAVIFRATINKLDEAYSETASRMRELAMNEYGCLEFVSVTEGDQEVSISYWNEQKDIIEWKNNSEHLAAQELGKSKWYKSYEVQMVEVVREYRLENR